MSFMAPVNDRTSGGKSRGVSSYATSRSEEVAIVVATFMLGFLVATIVTFMHTATDIIEESRLSLIYRIRLAPGLSPGMRIFCAWLAHFGFGIAFGSVALVCTLLVPTSRGSGLPQLITYLNGCKLKYFTSARTLVAKVVGTICALSGGFYCGPEGPIIHIGGCVGKLLLRSLYHMAGLATHCGGPLNSFFAAFAKLRNDLDQRDFVAIGSGAGVAAAFMAPISGTLFVAEEAASHFSLSLLWRTFAASVVALWACHGLIVRELLFGLTHLPDDSSGDTGGGASGSQAHLFHLKFDVGSGSACSPPDWIAPWVILLAALGGVVGAALNELILRVNAIRLKLIGPSPSNGRRARCGMIELLLLTLLSSSCSVLLPEITRCQPLSIGQLEYGCDASEAPPPVAGCAAAYEQCGGLGHNSSSGGGGFSCCPSGFACRALEKGGHYAQCLPVGAYASVGLNKACMPTDIRTQIKWTSAVNGTCDASCMGDNFTHGLGMLTRGVCAEGSYNDLAALLLQSSEGAVRALFLRGAPKALGAPALAIALLTWFCMTALTAGAPMPLGLMIPMIVIGGCLGRLFALGIGAFVGYAAEPSIFALLGSTSVLAGSGQIRLFLTVVMLEITDQLHLVPYVALAAIVSVNVAGQISKHGLYHANIHQLRLPYLPLEREVQRPSPCGCGGGGGGRGKGGGGHSGANGVMHGGSSSYANGGASNGGASNGGASNGGSSSGGVSDEANGGDGYLPSNATDELFVTDVMASDLVTVHRCETKRDVLERLRLATHNSFPVVDPTDGALDGLLLRSELDHFESDDTPVEAMMDRAPACVRPEWPVERAHRLFSALGLRHLLVVSRNGEPVGLLTRHDLQQRHHWRHASRTHAESAVTAADLTHDFDANPGLQQLRQRPPSSRNVDPFLPQSLLPLVATRASPSALSVPVMRPGAQSSDAQEPEAEAQAVPASACEQRMS